jgi:capsular exopolysaccharide synthesis family protein
VVFTSPLPGEGKTLSAINFALIGASRGLRMLLIDADLRCGMVSTVLGCSRMPGFAELLAGRADAGDVLRQISLGERGSLVAVPSGALPKVPGRVLTIERVHEVLAALAPQFDFVVIDTPPVNLLADAALLGSAADGVVLVVRAGHTQTEALRFAMEQLEATWAPVLGVLLNDIDLRRNVGDDSTYRYLAEVERYYVGAG